MGDIVIHNIAVSLAAFAFFLAIGVVCTFYTRWVQGLYTSDRYGPRLDLFYRSFGKKLSQSKYFLWHTRTIGVGALLTAAVALFELIRSLAKIL
jgi:hypothetical protein